MTEPRKDGWRDILQGISGAGVIAAAYATSFLRRVRAHWGISAKSAARHFPGDDLVPSPRWAFTHAIEIEASLETVWPWVAQIGADRAGFYSYQWLENLVGCDVKNADRPHPEWDVALHGQLSIHPKMPPLRVADMHRGHWFVAHGPRDTEAYAAGKPWVAVSWLFLLERIDDQRCRLVSRYRADSSSDLTTRLAFGPTLLEPISFAMDRRMLKGIKARAERRQASA